MVTWSLVPFALCRKRDANSLTTLCQYGTYIVTTLVKNIYLCCTNMRRTVSIIFNIAVPIGGTESNIISAISDDAIPVGNFV